MRRIDLPVEPEPLNRTPNLGLNDALALDRTALSNERTLLAYIRTSMTLLVVGGTILHFFESLILLIIGGFFIAIAVIAIVAGVARFRRMYGILQEARQMHAQSQSSRS
jgi:putative membrane protein